MAEEEEEEAILEGTAIRVAAVTTPVDIPMGMKTYGLDIVVKLVRCSRLWFDGSPRSISGVNLSHRSIRTTTPLVLILSLSVSVLTFLQRWRRLLRWWRRWLWRRRRRRR